MKRVSHKTIVNRIKRGESICPVCGCRGTRVVDYSEYPERWVQYFCSHCGQLVCYSDNSPWIDVCDLIREEKHISYKVCRKVAKEFEEGY